MPFHHFLPKTYLRSWGYSKKAVWTFNKVSNIAEPRKLKYLIGQENYHRIQAGSFCVTPEMANRMFSCLENYSIEYRGEKIKSSLEMNDSFPYFLEWIVRTQNDQVIDDRKKLELFNEIRLLYDDSIENDWNKKYENWWQSKLSRILTILKSHKTNSNIALDLNDLDFLYRTYVMFDWRCQAESNSVSLAFNYIEPIIEPIKHLRIPASVRYNNYDDTYFDEIKHAYYLQEYYNFLHDEGQMFSQVRLYQQELAFRFLVTESIPFITCESPAFSIIRGDVIEMVFIAHPNLLISLVRKDTENPRAYYTVFIDAEKVMEYNREIYKHGKILIGLDNCFSKYQ